ncbi:MAG: FadR/GntR family transcriptional regulator [Planctomycetota bacterium]
MAAGDALSLTDQVVQHLVDFIHDTGLKPGDSLPVEKALQEQLGVSRTILREALSYLKGLGLIESRRGSSFKVREVRPVEVFDKVLGQLAFFSEADIQEIFALRRIMEVGAVEQAVRHASQEQVDRILDLAERYAEACKGSGTKVDQKVFELEVAFHCAIVEPAQCDLLNVLSRSIAGFFARSAQEYSDRGVPQRTRESSSREHTMIAWAFAERQPEVALAVLRQHLGYPEEALKDE